MTANGLYAMRIGLSRGLIEFRATMTNVQELLGNLLFPAIMLIVLFFLRDTVVEQAGLPLATLALPSVIGMLLAYGGMVGVGTILAAEREDGTLLRAKALPNGISVMSPAESCGWPWRPCSTY